MKRFIFILFATSLTLISLSFIPSSTNNWKLVNEVDGINIYTQEIQCSTEGGSINNYIIFKYENSNSTSKTLNWRMDLYYNGYCRACKLNSPNEYEIQLELKPNEIKEGNCQSSSFAFKAFNSSPRGELSPLEKFEFTNLTIK